MKTLFTISTLVTMIITGVVSCRLFVNAHYAVSALLTAASLLSIISWITIVGDRRHVA